MIVAIHQPNYLPWLGFFNKMANCDVFVLLDNVKHSKSSFTHRNLIKLNNQEMLLSVPLKNKESLINELIISSPEENLIKHLRIIENAYRKSKFWNDYKENIFNIYNNNWQKLLDLNLALIVFLRKSFGIQTELILASELKDITGEGSDRNLSICKKLGAEIYLSGNGAKAYNDELSFQKEGIQIKYNNFTHPVYNQLGNHFIKNLAAIDLLFNCGEQSLEILLGRRI